MGAYFDKCEPWTSERCRLEHSSLREGLTLERCAAAYPERETALPGYRRYPGIDTQASTLKRLDAASAQDCADRCNAAPDCNAFVFLKNPSPANPHNCQLKAFGARAEDQGIIAVAGVGAVAILADDTRTLYVKAAELQVTSP
jgi:hypothetical protein